MDHTNTGPTILGALLTDASSQASFDDLTRDQLTTLLEKAFSALSAGAELVAVQSTEIAGLHQALEQLSHGAVGLLFDDGTAPFKFDQDRISMPRAAELLTLALAEIKGILAAAAKARH